MKIKKGWYALFVFPLIAVFVLVVVIPFFTGIGYSFVEWNGLAKVPKVFVGFDNYAGVFTDENFWASMGRTVVFTLITVVTVNVLALAFSLIVTTRLAARNVGRAMLFLPYLIGGLILGYIWKFVLGECMTTLGEMFGNQEVFFNWFTD